MPYRMQSGKWRAEKVIDGMRKTKTFETKEKAKKWEASQKVEDWNAPKIQIVTVLEWFNRYLDAVQATGYAQTTYKRKIRAAKLLISHTGEKMNAEDMTPAIAMEVLTKKARAISGGAANELRKELAAAWSWGVKYLGFPKDNPFAATDRFGHDEQRRYVPSETDFWKVVGVSKKDQRDMLLTILYTAARRGEVFRLTWSDIDIDARTVRLGTRKRQGGSMEYDHIPMVEPLAEVFGHMEKAGIYLFTQKNGQPYTTRAPMMGTLCRKANVKPFGFHAIRHLSASIMAKAGVSLPVIQGVLRHKNALTTTRYIRSLGVVKNEIEAAFSTSKGRQKSVFEMKSHIKSHRG